MFRNDIHIDEKYWHLTWLSATRRSYPVFSLVTIGVIMAILMLVAWALGIFPVKEVFSVI